MRNLEASTAGASARKLGVCAAGSNGSSSSRVGARCPWAMDCAFRLGALQIGGNGTSGRLVLRLPVRGQRAHSLGPATLHMASCSVEKRASESLAAAMLLATLAVS